MTAVDERQARAKSGLRLLLASTAASVTGDGMLISATPLMAAALTRDPVQIGLVAAASMAAWLMVGIPAGALVDRWDRRRVMIISDLVRAVALAGFLALMLLGRGSIPTLAITVFVVGIGTCFFTPASVALLPDIVGKDKAVLTSANGRIWSLDTFGRSLAGPPLGSAAFAVNRLLPFAVDAISFLASAVLLWFLPKSANGGQVSAKTPLWSAIKVGSRFLFADRELRSIAIGAGVYNFAFNIVASTLVLFALERLGIGVVGFGLLLACAAFGGIAAGWFAPRIIGDSSAMNVYAAAFAVQATCWLVMVMIPQVVVAAVALAMLGAASNTITVAGSTVRQHRTPSELIGRVASIARLLGSGGAAIGAAVGGVIAAARDQNATFWVAAVLLAAAAGVAWLEARVLHSTATED